MFKKLFFIVLFLAIAGGVLLALLWWNDVNFPISKDSVPVAVTIAQGERVKDIAAELEKIGVIRNHLSFEAYVSIRGIKSKFTEGYFKLDKNMDVREIVSALTSTGGVPEQSITLIEGWTAKDIAIYLEKQGIATAQDFITAASVTDSRTVVTGTTYDFLADKPPAATLEGYLFPDTYRIFKGASVPQIMEKMLDNFGNKYSAQMRADTAAGNMDIYKIVTLASIIEKEVRSDADRKIVAGIFYDRLNQGVALQSDATVNYVTGKQALQPTADDLSVDSPYNTYKYKGLPPGPICNPSLSSIMAAIYQQKSDYFYFLTKPDGTTVFSKTYEEHLQNKQKYLQ